MVAAGGCGSGCGGWLRERLRRAVRCERCATHRARCAIRGVRRAVRDACKRRCRFRFDKSQDNIEASLCQRQLLIGDGNDICDGEGICSGNGDSTLPMTAPYQRRKKKPQVEN